MDIQKKTVIIAGDCLDFPKGVAGTNRAREIGLALIDLGYDPLMIPLWLSREINGSVSGEYFGVKYRYLFNKRNILSSQLKGIAGFLIRRLYSLLVAIKVLLFISKRRENIKFVLLAANKPYVAFIIMLFAKLMGVKVVYDLVEEPFSTFILNESKSITFRNMIYRCLFAVDIFFLYLFILRLSYLLCCITNQQILLMKKCFYDSKKMFLLPILKYGTDSLPFDNAHISKDKFNIVYSGKLSLEKDGIENILYAFKNVVLKMDKVYLGIYGYGSDEENLRIIKKIKDLGLEGRALFKGYVEREELERAQKDATLLMLLKNKTKQNKYNFPTKMIDYLSIGKPIIMTGLETHKNYFENGISAIFVDPLDYSGIADKIIWVINNLDEASCIGRAGREILKKHFDAKKNISDLLKRLG